MHRTVHIDSHEGLRIEFRFTPEEVRSIIDHPEDMNWAIAVMDCSNGNSKDSLDSRVKAEIIRELLK